MKRSNVIWLVMSLIFTLVISQGFALLNEGETAGVSFLKGSFSETLTKADKPIMIDFWSDG